MTIHDLQRLKTWRGSPILSVSQFTRSHLDDLLSVADGMKKLVAQRGTSDLCQGRVLSNVFYEPSTRTSTSFYAAMLRLGGKVVSLDMKNSSVKKGESLEDTVRCLESYSDIIVLRHPKQGSTLEASKVLEIPLISAGDGTGEHPTQALLDLYTIKSELGKIDGLTVTLVGDLKHGRTVHSLASLLTNFNVKLNYVSPESLRMPKAVSEAVKAKGISQSEVSDLGSVLSETDILYVTRIQKERFASESEYMRVKNSYIITPKLLKENGAKSSMRILHPLPRVNEITVAVDMDPRAAYFRQMKCGLFVRMALLALVLGEVEPSWRGLHMSATKSKL